MTIDELDRRLIATLARHPRVGLVEIARRLGVARGTVQARLRRLVDRGVVEGFGPQLNLPTMGYPVLAFVFLEIVQGRLQDAVAALDQVPEVLEAHATSGSQDLICRVVARDSEHLQEVLNRALASPVIQRSTSYIALSHPIPYRTLPLVETTGGE